MENTALLKRVMEMDTPPYAAHAAACCHNVGFVIRPLILARATATRATARGAPCPARLPANRPDRSESDRQDPPRRCLVFCRNNKQTKKGWTAGGVPAGARNRGAWRSHWARACRNARAVPDPHVPRTDLYSAGDFRFPWVFLSRAIAAFCAERPQHKGDFYNPTRCAVLVSGRKLRVGKPPSGSCTKSLGEGAAGVSDLGREERK